MAYREANQFYDVGQTVGFRNRIINGDMRIDQRNNGAVVNNSAATNTYVVDRFSMFGTEATKISGQQSTAAPTGFVNSWLITSLAATTATSAQAYGVRHIIEGTNISDLAWGTANAQPVTLSFWVRSSITGTYALALFNRDSPNRSYVTNYTINSANTFEYKTITISGDTSGTWLTTNGQGIQVWWDLGSGSNFNETAGNWVGSLKARTSGSANWIGTNGATFYITGVQLEKGSTATSFDYRPYGTELGLCQRYFEKLDVRYSLVMNINSSEAGRQMLSFAEKRAVPTVSFSFSSVSNFQYYGNSCSGVALADATTKQAMINYTGFNAWSPGNGGVVYVNTTNTGNRDINISSEL
jgi:hypothetical protein